MSRVFFLSVAALLFTLCFRSSFENLCSNPFSDPQCRRRNQICCNGACNSTCIGKHCRWDFQCGSRSQGHKCCAGHCRTNCEGLVCHTNSDCKDRSLKCCNNICRKDSCLGSVCNSLHPSYRTCGWHRGKRLDCCSGRCELSCRDKPCLDNRDCGGWGRSRMKCCNGVCKKSCRGSSCLEHRDCQSSKLDCCGFFENRTCARSCLNHGCSLAEKNECGRQRYPRLFCCGDGTCRRTCEGSICYTETFRYDCRSPERLLYCCGMSQKECHRSCGHLRCEKNEDCGTSQYYCGRPNRHNISTCRFTHVSDILVFHDVRLDSLDFN